MNLIFEWDKDKAKANIIKHKISFDEGKTVFNDPFLMTFPDPYHSDKEKRFINIGYSVKGRILIVIHTERNFSIRIISCRKASPNERREYEETNF
ncbi:BrnT family toxin [Candidatus Magnetomoraceae bacterium gMMP-15]